MSASRFIDLLEENQLLEPSVIADLRKKTAQRQGRVTSESIARALVEKGLLTRFQATKLIDQAASVEEPPKSSDDEHLGLAPDDSTELSPQEVAGVAANDDEDHSDVVILEEAGDIDLDDDDEEPHGLTPVEDAGAGLTPVAARQPARAQDALHPLSDAGGLDSIDPHMSAGPPQDPFASPAAGKPERAARGPRSREPRKTRWDTKLLLGGTTVLALLVILGYVLWVNLTTAPAVEMWEAAMQDYRSESYSQAMAKFEDFLSAYPNEENASEARARIALCRIRTVLSDPQKGLDRAMELLPTIETESAFGVVRPELGTMLIQIPQGFIRKAKLSGDMQQKEQMADLAEAGMNDLVRMPKYVPTSVLQSIQREVDDVTEDINRVRRDINQDRDLRATIAKIGELLNAQDTLGAFAEFKQLTRTYPGLENDADLLASVQEITNVERGLVAVHEEPIEPLPPRERSLDEHRRIVLATRRGEGSTRVKNQTAAVLAGGSVYGLDAGSGKVLWDRFVGYGSTSHPIRTSSQPDADVILVDGDEVVRVTAATGEVQWRLPASDAVVAPALAGDRVFVATADGRLIEADATTGESPRQAKIPQTLTTGPSVSVDRPLLFQAGLHSNLYALSTATLACEDVYYIGHKDGAVGVPPLTMMGHVFVAENAGQDFCLLHTLAINESDGETGVLKKVQEPIRLFGNVVVPLIAYGNRLMVVTNRSDVRVFNINVNATESPLSEAATKAPTPDEPKVVYPLADAGTLWLADNRLAKFRIQVTTKDVNLLESVNRGDAYVAPLQLHGDLLVGVRRARASVGVTVSAVNIDQPRDAVWSTDLAVPAGRVSVSPESGITVVSATGSLFRIDKDSVANGYNDQPQTTARSRTGSLSFTDEIELGDGRIVFFNPADNEQLLVFDPSQTSSPLRVVTLQLDGATITCIPIAFQGGLLVPLDRGEILLIDPSDGSQKLLPFQPRLEPGEKVQWVQPAVVGENGDEFVIANDRKELYRVGVKDQPRPFLAELAKSQLQFAINSPLAAADDAVYGVVRNTGGDTIAALDAAELTIAQEFDLAGERVTWGPVRLGDAVFAVTDGTKLRCYDASRQARWETPGVAHGRPAGKPLLVGNDLVFASLDGWIWRVSAQTGQELAQDKLDEPLGAGPVAFGTRLLLCGNDGSLHVVPMPAATATPAATPTPSS